MSCEDCADPFAGIRISPETWDALENSPGFGSVDRVSRATPGPAKERGGIMMEPRKESQPGDQRQVWGAICAVCHGGAYQMYALLENGTPEGVLGWGPAHCINTNCTNGPRLLKNLTAR
jgi:hypothetical protein